MVTKKKVVDLASEEWRVHTVLPHIVEAIEGELTKKGKSLEEAKYIGYISGKDALFYRIDYEIAKFLDKNHCGECMIQHRPVHEKKDFYRWAEWLGENRNYVESRKPGGKMQALKVIQARRKSLALKLR